MEEEIVSTRVLTTPNLISAARLALVPVFVWLFLTRTNDTLAIVILAIIGGTDWVDGFVARHTGQVSRLGKLLDPIADRIAIVALLFAFTFRGTISWLVAAVIVVRDILVALVFPILEARGVPRLEVSLVGKAATFLIYGGIGWNGLSLVLPPAKLLHETGTAFLWVGATLYWVAGVMYALEARRRLRAMDENP